MVQQYQQQYELPYTPPQGLAHGRLSTIEAAAGKASVWTGQSTVMAITPLGSVSTCPDYYRETTFRRIGQRRTTEGMFSGLLPL